MKTFLLVFVLSVSVKTFCEMGSYSSKNMSKVRKTTPMLQVLQHDLSESERLRKHLAERRARELQVLQRKRKLWENERRQQHKDRRERLAKRRAARKEALGQ